MAKICFPHHTRGEFSSLNEAFRYLRKREYGWSWFTLTEIVKCNVFYRDYLREHGIDSLGPPAPMQPLLLGLGLLLLATAPNLGCGVAPLGRHP